MRIQELREVHHILRLSYDFSCCLLLLLYRQLHVLPFYGLIESLVLSLGGITDLSVQFLHLSEPPTLFTMG